MDLVKTKGIALNFQLCMWQHFQPGFPLEGFFLPYFRVIWASLGRCLGYKVI